MKSSSDSESKITTTPKIKYKSSQRLFKKSSTQHQIELISNNNKAKPLSYLVLSTKTYQLNKNLANILLDNNSVKKTLNDFTHLKQHITAKSSIQAEEEKDQLRVNLLSEANERKNERKLNRHMRQLEPQIAELEIAINFNHSIINMMNEEKKESGNVYFTFKFDARLSDSEFLIQLEKLTLDELIKLRVTHPHRRHLIDMFPLQTRFLPLGERILNVSFLRQAFRLTVEDFTVGRYLAIHQYMHIKFGEKEWPKLALAEQIRIVLGLEQLEKNSTCFDSCVIM